MATYTTATTGVTGIREDLSDVITRISPEETPLVSSLASRSANNIQFDWQHQELKTAAANNVAEGADATEEDPIPPLRLVNVTQISQKTVKVSGTLDAVDTAGRAEETAYQKALKALELRRDIEHTILNEDQQRTTGATRKTATLSSWISNLSRGASPDPLPFTQDADGDGVNDIYDGSSASIHNSASGQRLLTLEMIEDMMEAAYSDGGSPDRIIMSPGQKRKFSNLAITANTVADVSMNQTAARPATAIGAVDVFLTDFGQLDVVVDRFCHNDRAFLLDPNYAKFVTLPGRNYVTTELAKTGDSSKFQCLCEWGLEISSPKAHAAIYDLKVA